MQLPAQGDTFDPDTLVWVHERTALKDLLDTIENSHLVSFDTETTGLDEHATLGGRTNGGFPARVVMATFTTQLDPDDMNPTNWVLPLSHPESPWLGRWRKVLKLVAQRLKRANVPLAAQNGKFDCRWVYAHSGVDLAPQLYWDTQISSHLIDETWTTSLKPRAAETFGIPRWDDHDLTYPGAAEDVPMFELGEYAARDTYWTWRLALRHRDSFTFEDPPSSPDEWEDLKLGQLNACVSMPTVRTLSRIEQRGFGVDREWIGEELAKHQAEMSMHQSWLLDRYPEDEILRRLNPDETTEYLPLARKVAPSLAPTAKWFRAWAEVAVERGDLRIGAMTAGGAPQWNRAVLARQARQGSEVATQLLAYRDHAKKCEFLRGWLDEITPAGRIHATYRAGSVATGRLSSAGPNMQQVTRVLRPAFIPSPGYVLADIDYSQIEMRVAAFISRSEPMMAAFVRGDDLHSLLAARIENKPVEQVTKEERQGAKAGNFGLIFGMGPEGFQTYAESAYGVILTEGQAIHMHEQFFEMWDGVRQWHQRAIAGAYRTGQVVSPIGRVRRIQWNQGGYGGERQAINSPVQGFASDIMQIASASIEGMISGHQPIKDARIVATVHDSIVVEVPEDRWEEVTRECLSRMTVRVHEVLIQLGCTFDVPIVAEAGVGTRWGLTDVGELI